MREAAHNLQKSKRNLKITRQVYHLTNWCSIGLVGVGGILLDPNGTIVTLLAWVLGIATNNQAEWYALMLRAELVVSLRVQKLIILEYLFVVRSFGKGLNNDKGI